MPSGLGADELVPQSILKTRKLVRADWSYPNGSGGRGAALVRTDGLWQLTSRGIFEIDLKSGDSAASSVAKTWDRREAHLLLTDRWLLAVSNRMISASTPRRGAPWNDVPPKPTLDPRRSRPAMSSRPSRPFAFHC